jgi:hypothetical protein
LKKEREAQEAEEAKKHANRQAALEYKKYLEEQMVRDAGDAAHLDEMRRVEEEKVWKARDDALAARQAARDYLLKMVDEGRQEQIRYKHDSEVLLSPVTSSSHTLAAEPKTRRKDVERKIPQRVRRRNAPRKTRVRGSQTGCGSKQLSAQRSNKLPPRERGSREARGLSRLQTHAADGGDAQKEIIGTGRCRANFPSLETIPMVLVTGTPPGRS